ncbi:MAG: hypothetical protein HYS04_10045 [Acidobacteria bacterium]|nr:hypothetical protein [Acidobacteriota bacterium]
MDGWKFAQQSPSEQLARLHQFSMKKQQPDGEIEFVITVREYVSADIKPLLFFAQADKQTNQKNAPFTPCGYGETLEAALSDCIRNIHKFPYEGRLSDPAQP